MARTRQIIETVTCDVCGATADDATTITLGWGRDQWELDVCPADSTKLADEFDGWVANGRRVRSRSASGGGRTRGSNDDWDYLESKGFKRHRGRKTAEEVAALAARR